jgi:hypothetical protein
MAASISCLLTFPILIPQIKIGIMFYGVFGTRFIPSTARLDFTWQVEATRVGTDSTLSQSQSETVWQRLEMLFLICP